MSKLERYSSYKNSGVKWLGEIPEEWEVKKLKYISEIKTGYTPDTSKVNNYIENGTVWVKPDNLKEFTLIYDSKEKISSKGVKKQNIIPKGSLLVNCIGTIGKFGIAGVDLITNQQINAVTFNTIIENNFGKYLIFASSSEHNRLSNGNVVQILNTTAQGIIKFAIPPKQEQTKIASFLDTKTKQLDKAIKQKEQLIKLLKERRQILINDAVTKGIDTTVTMKDSGVEWIGDVPEGWETRKLFGLCNFIRGNSSFSKDELLSSGKYVALQYGKTYKVDKIDEKYKFYVNDEFYKKSQTVNFGDTIFISTSETIEDLGHSAYYNRKDLGLLGGEQILLNPKKYVINSSYLYFSSKVFSKELKKFATGIKVFRFNINDLKTIYVPLPSKQEQEVIVNYIEKNNQKIDKAIDLQQQQITKLKEYKTTLIDSVVTGKVKVS